MARTLTPLECYELINAVADEAIGKNQSLQAVDTSTFISVGETILATGVENTINSLSIVLGRTFMAVRPYSARFSIVDALNDDMYNTRLRKISYYMKEAKPSGWFNTDEYTNHYAGYDNGTNSSNSTKSQWEQCPPVALEMNFAGSSTWQKCMTFYEDVLKIAFSNETEFAQFIAGAMQRNSNDIELEKEAFNRATFLNYIGGIYDLQSVMNGSVINLTKAFNDKFNTNYTSAQLRSTYLESFAKFCASEFQKVSDRLTHESINRHWSPDKTIGSDSFVLPRNTPKKYQKFAVLSDLWSDIKTEVMPNLFNPNYLDFGNFESIDFWQNENDPAAIDVTPAIPDCLEETSTGVQIEGDEVELDYVVGVMFDKDGCMVSHQLERALSTGVEARKGYRNTWFTFAKNGINDFTENAVLFIMADPEPDPDPDGNEGD